MPAHVYAPKQEPAILDVVPPVPFLTFSGAVADCKASFTDLQLLVVSSATLGAGCSQLDSCPGTFQLPQRWRRVYFRFVHVDQVNVVPLLSAMVFIPLSKGGRLHVWSQC